MPVISVTQLKVGSVCVARICSYTDCCVDKEHRRSFMTAPCLSISDHLDFGALSISGDNMFHNSTRDTPNIYAVMVPITIVEVDEGIAVGVERTITKRSGVYSAPPGMGFSNSTSYWFKDCLLIKTKMGTLRVSMELAAGDIVVIVWN
jgi:hypothetical protein